MLQDPRFAVMSTASFAAAFLFSVPERGRSASMCMRRCDLQYRSSASQTGRQILRGRFITTSQATTRVEKSPSIKLDCLPEE